MSKKQILLLFILVATSVTAQLEPYYLSYEWDENPKYIAAAEGTQDIQSLKENYVVEFFYTEQRALTEYYLEHKVLWLNSDDKIEDYNKVYLPYNASTELKVSKARVVTQDGRVIVLDESKILTAEDEETGKQYKYFAFEGIEKGSFIEYYYVEKKYPQYRGSRFWLQSSYDKKNVSFDLYAPINLVFKFKSYNELAEVTKDSLTTDRQHWGLNVDKLKGLEDEQQAPYDASRGFLIYKLDRNLKNNTTGISAYSKTAQNVYEIYYPEHPKKTMGLLEEFVSDNISTGANNEETIKNLENYIKSNFYVTSGVSDELEDLNSVITKKVANKTGMVKLYAAVLKTLGIKHEMVITSDRQNLRFDKEFEASIFLSSFLYYFPETKGYLSPTKIESRYGFPPAYLTDNYGLFIKEVSVGAFKSGLGKVKYIKPVKSEETVDRMVIDVHFDENDISKNRISLDRSFTGYYGMYIHPYVHLLKENDKEELFKGFMQSMDQSATILDKKLVNDDPALFGIEPIQFVLDLESEAFTEKAGRKYLFKLGELIGEQMQMYQEKERVLPLENEFERTYYRTITLNLPKGYRIANLDDIKIDNSYVRDDQELLAFKSDYTLEGDVLTIKADEHYSINTITTDFFEDYREVINSAADFNKVTLVLEPVE